jgi:hypothetical protein
MTSELIERHEEYAEKTYTYWIDSALLDDLE